MPAAALYVHVPFCAQKCRYCDFDSRALRACDREQAMDVYFEKLAHRLDVFATTGALDAIETVYIGGGTPSLAGEHLVALTKRISDTCHPVEFTCEANPESMTGPLARTLKSSGVTRISLGVQSLVPRELAAIGRIHTAERALGALSVCKAAGLVVSCDLMCGLPRQTSESWSQTLAGILEADPDHVSVYPLTLEEGTPLALAAENDPSLVPDEDFQADCMETARRVLAERGYAPYEVASYAKPGYACAHNIAYWTGRGYLGLGRSAAGMLDRVDFDALATLFPGVEVPPDAARVRMVQLDDEASAFDAEFLTARETAAEDLMLGCRMTAGISPAVLHRASNVIPLDALIGACEHAVELGLASWRPDGNAPRPDPHATDGIDPRDVISGSVNAHLAPTQLGWLDGNVLFELFWELSGTLV